MYKIGVDLGGTKMEGIVLSPENKEVNRLRIPTEREKGYEHILTSLAYLYNNLLKEIDYAPHTMGIGTPGAMSKRTGLLKNSNTLCMNGKPFLKDFEEKIAHKVGIENDANCFAMAEAVMGAGKGYANVFGVIMGTGCGGGIVIDGKVVSGLQGIGGEWGHMVIDPFYGPMSYTGKRGTVEEYISGTGLESRYKERTGKADKLPNIVGRYREGVKEDVEFMEYFFDVFGICLSNLINILDPDIIVLGGGVSNISELYTQGVESIQKHVFNDVLETKVVQHQLGDSAGVFGAAFIGK